MFQYCQMRFWGILGQLSLRKVDDLTGRKRLYVLSLILTVVTLSVIASTITILYSTALDEERGRLFEVASSRAKFMEAVARYDLDDFNNFHVLPEGMEARNVKELAAEATLLQLVDAHENFTGFGESGEYTVAKKVDSSIVFLMSHRHYDLSTPRSVSINSNKAEPMRRALSGKSGTMIGRDYRGEKVLAAYEPVDVLDIGIVAKIDMAEIRSPFIVAGLWTALIGMLLIIVGILLFDRVTSPLMRQMEESKERLQLALEGGGLGIWDWDIESDVITINDGYSIMLGYSREEISLSPAQKMKMIHPEDRARKTESLNQHLSGTTSEYECEYRIRSKSDEWVWVHDKGKIVAKDKKGKPLRITGTHLDITARKSAERELQQLNNSLRQSAAFPANNPGPLLRSNMEGIICDANPGAKKTFGATVTGQELNSLFPAGKSLFDEKAPWNIPSQFEHEIEESTFLMTVVKDEQSHSIYLYGTDITQRKFAENEMRKLTQAIEQSPSAVTITDINGDIEFVNQSYVDMTGFSAYEVMGKNQYELIPEKRLRGIYQQLLKTVKDGRAWSGEYRSTRKNGEWYWISATVSPIKNENGVTTHYLAMQEDITKRKQAEDELRKLSKAVEQSPVSIVITNIKSEIEYVNPKFEQLTGYSLDEVLGKNPRILKSGFQTEEVYKDLWDTITDGRSWSGEFQNKKKNGELYWEAIAICPVKNDNGKTTHYLAIKEDITEKKQLEDELAIAQQLESIGVLAGGIAHDFNNILTAIMGNVSLAKLKAESGSLMHELLDEAEKASIRAKDLTNQLLTFSKGGSPVLKSASIADVIEESVQFALCGSTVSCDISISADLHSTHIDENQISQVLTNLVINARQAMSDGGKLKIQCENCIITEDSPLPLKPGGYVSVSVCDNGTGISPDNLEKIFDPYFTTKKTGSGLGLATSFSIAKKHGGLLRAESIVGEGSIFTLYLPASLHQSANTAKRDDEIIKGSGRILIMDDEQPIRHALRSMLDMLGYEVTSTSEGAEAIERFKEAEQEGRPFYAVILDMTIPGGMGGKETLEKLLELKPQVKAIISSGYSDDSIIAQYEEYGFCGQVPKPYKIDELSKVLSSAIHSEEQPA